MLAVTVTVTVTVLMARIVDVQSRTRLADRRRDGQIFLDALSEYWFFIATLRVDYRDLCNIYACAVAEESFVFLWHPGRPCGSALRQHMRRRQVL
jgi:hypothetical protein